MNYGGMALEGLWRGMDYSNQRRQQQMAMEQQAFHNQMAQKQMAMQMEQFQMQKKQYEDEREQQRHDNFFKYASFAEKAAKANNKALFDSAIAMAGKYAMDNQILPQMDFNQIQGEEQAQRNMGLDMHLYEKGLRRAGEADFADPEGLMSRPPQGMIMMGNVPTVPMPKQLPQEPVGMEYVTDENNVLRALPKAIMPGQVPQPIDTGVRMPVKGGAGGSDSADVQLRKWYIENLGVTPEDADKRAQSSTVVRQLNESFKMLTEQRQQLMMGLILSGIPADQAMKHPSLSELNTQLEAISGQMRAVFGGGNEAPRSAGNPIELNVPGLGVIKGTVR